MQLLRNEKDINEAHFLEAFTRGESHAVDYFFNRYAKQLYAFSFKFLKSDADSEEIVQDIFLKIWENRQRINPQLPFRPYLFTVTMNAIRKHFLAKAKTEKFKTELYDLFSKNPQKEDEEIDFHFYMTQLDKHIQSLPERRKEIFLMHYKEGLTISEIANYLTIAPKTVENQLTAAMKTIRECFYNSNITGFCFWLMLNAKNQAVDINLIHS